MINNPFEIIPLALVGDSCYISCISFSFQLVFHTLQFNKKAIFKNSKWLCKRRRSNVHKTSKQKEGARDVYV